MATRSREKGELKKAGISTGDSRSDEVKLHEAMRAAQEALRAAEQDEVEWREEDMNDPQLLEEMSRLERGEEAKGEEEARGEGEEEVVRGESAMKEEEMRHEEVKKGMMDEAKMDVSEEDEGTREKRARVNKRMREVLEEATEAKKRGDGNAREKALLYLKWKELRRKMDEGDRVEWEEIDDLDIGDVEVEGVGKETTEIQVPRTPSQPTSSLASSPMDTSKGSKVNPSSNSPALTSSKAPPSLSVSMATNQDHSPQHHHQPNKQATPSLSASYSPLSEEELRVKRFEQLEGLLMIQLEEMKKHALELNALNRKAEALAVITKRKSVVKDVEWLKMGKEDPSCPPPLFHIESVEHFKEILNEDLSAYEAEIGIIRVEDVKPVSLSDKHLECFISAEIPLPDPAKPTLITTPIVGGAKDPQYPTLNPKMDFFQKVRIDRPSSSSIASSLSASLAASSTSASSAASKALVRSFQKRRVVFSLWKPKSWFLGSNTLIGKAELKLSPLLEQSDIHEVLDLLDESGHKVIGGKMIVSVRIRFPLAKRNIIREVQKTLVIDKHFVGEEGIRKQPEKKYEEVAAGRMDSSSQAVPSSGSNDGSGTIEEKEAKPEESGTGTNTMDISASSSAAGNDQSPNNDNNMLIDESDYSHQHHPPSSSSTSSQKNNSRMSVDLSTPLQPTLPTVSSTSTSNDSNKNSANTTSGQSNPSESKEDPAFDFNSAAWMISHAVLGWRKEMIEKEIAEVKRKIDMSRSAEQPPSALTSLLDSLESSKDDIDHKVTILITLVQTGNLTEEEYIKRVKKKIGEEEELVARLESVNRLSEASLAKKRIQIMKEEIGA